MTRHTLKPNSCEFLAAACITSFAPLPVAMVAASRRPRRGDVSLLAEMGRSLEAQATGSGAAALVVRTVGRECELTQLTARSWDGVQGETGMTPAGESRRKEIHGDAEQHRLHLLACGVD